MRLVVSSAIAGAALAVFTSVAPAATVALNPDGFAPGASVTSDYIAGSVQFGVTGSKANRADPWASTTYAGTGEYVSVQAGSAVTYSFAQNQTAIDLLWGTPDDYNTITFYLGGEFVDSITGGDTQFANFDDQTTNRFVTVTSNSAFNSVKYSSGADAFEFATADRGTITPVPLPAAGLLLLGAMGGIATLRKRRKA